jgi:hypothetical protein
MRFIAARIRSRPSGAGLIRSALIVNAIVLVAAGQLTQLPGTPGQPVDERSRQCFGGELLLDRCHGPGTGKVLKSQARTLPRASRWVTTRPSAARTAGRW